MKTIVLKLNSYFGDFKKLEDYLNDGWTIQRADVLQGNSFSKCTSNTFIVYILTK